MALSNRSEVKYVVAENGSLWSNSQGGDIFSGEKQTPFDGNTPAGRIMQVAGEDSHEYCVTDSGVLYWRTVFADWVTDDDHFWKIFCPDVIGNTCVAMVACSSYSRIIVLTVHGAVWTNDFVDNVLKRMNFEVDGAPPHIHMVACGISHNVALAECGTVWVSGNGVFGQLGLGDHHYHESFARVGGDADFQSSFVVLVAADRYQTAAITLDGTVWMWGLNDYQTTTRSVVQRMLPWRLAELSTPAVVVSCIGAAALAVTCDGALWMWGSIYAASLRADPIDEGRTQHGDTGLRLIGDAASFGNSRAVSVAVGYRDAMVLTEDGGVWSVVILPKRQASVNPSESLREKCAENGPVPPRKLFSHLGGGACLRAGRYQAMVHPEIAVLFAAITQSESFRRDQAPATALARLMAAVLGLWQRATPRAAAADVSLPLDVMRLTLQLTGMRPPASCSGIAALLGGGLAPRA